MNAKRLAVMRILLLILFSFGLSWLLFLLCGILGIFQDDAGFQLRSTLMMFTPAIGSLLTRLVTKEGMADSYLRLNLKGSKKYYLLAIVLPFIYIFLEDLLDVLFMNARLDPAAVFEQTGFSAVGYTAAIFFNIAITAALFPIYLGEELGWRGYLYPKLKEVMNRPAAYTVGGIIWGLWHAPAIINGLNFGKDYAGYPYAGILLMCLFCMASGIIFMWLTEKTGSVYPAVLAHGVNNNAAGFIAALAITDKSGDNIIKFFALGSAATFIVAMVCIAAELFSQRRKRA